MIDTTEERDRELFDRIAKEYSKKDQVPSCRKAREYQLHTGMGALLTKKIPLIVEIGCGIGASAEYMEGAFDSYIGIDYSEEQIRQARLAHTDQKGVSFIVKNVKELTPSDIPPTDVVLAVGAFHHFTELDKAFSAITSVMKNGAWLVAIEPQRQNPIIQLLRFIRTKVDKGYSSDQIYFSGQELTGLLERNGFTDIEIQYEGFFSPPFAQVAFNPQWLFLPLSRLSILLDKVCDRILPAPLKRLSWNLVARARYSEGQKHG